MLTVLGQSGSKAHHPSSPLTDGWNYYLRFLTRSLEFVLIPAGKFVMGVPFPSPVDEVHFVTQIGLGQSALAISMGVLLVLLGFVIGRALRERHRPHFSLARLMVLALVAGVGLLGGLHWRHTNEDLDEDGWCWTQRRSAARQPSAD